MKMGKVILVECSMSREQCGFRCTGYDGGRVWKQVHSAADGIECEECRQHGKDLFSFAHDIVNLGLGKDAYDRRNFHKILKEANCVASKCLIDGRC